MVTTPLVNDGYRPVREPTVEDAAVVEANEGLVALIGNVNVRRLMIGEVHADMDAEEARDDRHRAIVALKARKIILFSPSLPPGARYDRPCMLCLYALTVASC